MVTTLTYGGAEIQVSILAKKFLARGWKVFIITLIDPKALHQELTAEGVNITSLGMKGGFPDPRAIIKLSKEIKRIKPSLVHGHMIHANLLTRITRALTFNKPNIPFICTAHSLREGGKVMELLYRITDKYCDLNTNVSQAAVNRFIKVRNTPSDKIRKIFNGIETEKFQFDEGKRKAKRSELNLNDDFTWFAAGRLTEAKNFDLLLDSFKEYNEIAPQSCLLIAGEGELEDDLKSKIDKLNIKTSVRLLGRRTDIGDLMCASDAYVLSSLWEGLPLVLLEASSIGLPIIATDVGGNAEIVCDGKSGRLVPTSDQQALTGAMLEMSSLSEDKRKKLGTYGSKFIKSHFGIEAIIDQWESTYNELLHN